MLMEDGLEKNEEAWEMLLLLSLSGDSCQGCDKTRPATASLVLALDKARLKRGIWGAGPGNCAVTRQPGRCVQ